MNNFDDDTLRPGEINPTVSTTAIAEYARNTASDWLREQEDKLIEAEMAALDETMRDSIAKLQANAEAGWREAGRAWKWATVGWALASFSIVLLAASMAWMIVGDKL